MNAKPRTRAKHTAAVPARRRVLSAVVACLLALSSAAAYPSAAHAKAIGSKNEKAKANAIAVATGETPSMPDYNNGYAASSTPYKKLLGGAVYRGGNAKSATTSGALDNDPNDFASVLPYGDVYIDAEKISFESSNSQNFTIDINPNYATKFAWVASSTSLSDSQGHHPTIAVAAYAGSAAIQGDLWTNYGNIAYTGGLKPYLSATSDGNGVYTITDKYKECLAASYGGAWSAEPQTTTSYNYLNQVLPAGTEGYTNKVAAAANDYLYRITFNDAAILPNGSRGNVVITTTAVEMESSIDVAEGAPIGIQGANIIGVNPVFEPVEKDSSGTKDSRGVPLVPRKANNPSSKKVYIPDTVYVKKNN